MTHEDTATLLGVPTPVPHSEASKLFKVTDAVNQHRLRMENLEVPGLATFRGFICMELE